MEWKLEHDLCEQLYEALFKFFRNNAIDADQSEEAKNKLFMKMTYSIMLFARVATVCHEPTSFKRFSRRLVEENDPVLYWAIKLFVDDEWSKQFPWTHIWKKRRPERTINTILRVLLYAASISEVSELAAVVLLDLRSLQLSFYLATSSKVSSSMVIAIEVFHYHVSTAMELMEGSGNGYLPGRVAFRDLLEVCDNNAEAFIKPLIHLIMGVYDMMQQRSALPDADPIIAAARSIDIMYSMLQVEEHPFRNYILEESMAVFGFAFLTLSGDPSIFKKKEYALVPEVLVKVSRTISQYAFGADAGWEGVLLQNVARGLISAYPNLPEKQLEDPSSLYPAVSILSKLAVFHFHPGSLSTFERGMKVVPPEMHQNVLASSLGPAWHLYCTRFLEQYIFLCYFETAGIWQGCWLVSV